MEFEGDAVTLRSFVLTDAEALSRVASDTTHAALLKHPLSIDEAIAFIEAAQSSADSEIYAITFDAIVIGAVGLERISENKNARLYAWVGADYASGPYLEESIRIALKRAFRDLRLHKVYARVLVADADTHKRLRSFGFRSEGVLREHVIIRRRYHDVRVLGLLKGEMK